MQLKQCPNGHFFDPGKSPNCPHCEGGSANVSVTQPAQGAIQPEGGVGVTVPATSAQQPFNTVPVNSGPSDDGVTMIGGYKPTIGIDPVVGWLVCVDGKEKGRDHRIHAEYNYIGRAESMDICIRDDEQISRDKHAIIVYDPQSRMYFFSKGTGQARGIVRHNGAPVMGTERELKAYDTIEIGQSKFIFVPLCGEGFDWLN